MAFHFDDQPGSVVTTLLRAERTDDRRNKVYNAFSRLYVHFYKDEWSETSKHFHPSTALNAASRACVEAGDEAGCFDAAAWGGPGAGAAGHTIRVKVFGWSWDRANAADEDGRWGVTAYARIAFTVDKPSLIPDVDACNRLLEQIGMGDALRKASRQIIEEYAVATATDSRVEQAGRVLSQMKAKARTKAQEIVRYKQRLAALNAEYAAECVMQAEAIVADKEPWTWSDGKLVDPRVVAAVRGKLPNESAVREDEFFGRSAEGVISAEDVS
jgi:hypothetical protein